MGLGLCSAIGSSQSTKPVATTEADITLRIQEITLDLAPRRSVKTLAYNGQVPGPLLRVTEGKSISVDVWNDTKNEELVHWHGLHLPSDVDGAMEEGTPHVPPRGHQRYVFTPSPSGTRWYHTHIGSGRNFRIGTYTGQFGMMIVEPSSDPGRYDLEVPILLHEWEPQFTMDGPVDIEYKLFSINGKMLGAGEPIRVRPSQRVLFRIVNASATEHHRLALPGHAFEVVAMDGNPLRQTHTVPVIDLGPGERIDAIVEMKTPGVWIFGELRDSQRNGGMGIIIEYQDAQGPPRWLPAAPFTWDYTAFGGPATVVEPDGRIPLVFKQAEGSHRFTINGKSFPNTAPLIVESNRRYRMIFDNQSADAHPVHLHRHTFEITKFDQKLTSGIWKDVVVVPAWKEVEVDLVANNPGKTLFHCHQQFHMDSGFMALMEYSK